jgi:hypothetical protein
MRSHSHALTSRSLLSLAPERHCAALGWASNPSHRLGTAAMGPDHLLLPESWVIPLVTYKRGEGDRTGHRAPCFLRSKRKEGQVPQRTGRHHLATSKSFRSIRPSDQSTKNWIRPSVLSAQDRGGESRLRVEWKVAG